MNPLRNLCSLKCFLILTILITEHEVSNQLNHTPPPWTRWNHTKNSQISIDLHMHACANHL